MLEPRKALLIQEINEAIAYLREVLPEVNRTVELTGLLMRLLVRELELGGSVEEAAIELRQLVRELEPGEPPPKNHTYIGGPTTPSNPDDELLTVDQIGELLRLRNSTLYVLMKHEGFPKVARRIGRSRVWLRSEIEEWSRNRKKTRGGRPRAPTLADASATGEPGGDDDGEEE